MEIVVKWAGYIAIAYFVLYGLCYRFLLALLASRNAFKCDKSSSSRSRWVIALGLFGMALFDPHAFQRIGNQTIWWRGFRSGVRWSAVKDYNDQNQWRETIANGHAKGHNFFELHDTTRKYYPAPSVDGAFSFEGEWREVERRVYVDLCNCKLDVRVHPFEVVRVDAHGEFDWLNDPDQDFILFLIRHFDRVVVIRNTGNSDRYAFSGLNGEEVKINGEVYTAFGLDFYYDDTLDEAA